MCIGRIITKSKKVNSIELVHITDDVNAIDNTIPTLIVGKTLAEEIYGKENIHLMDKKISKNVYWTYSKLEKRSVFELDIEKFHNFILKSLSASVKYTFFNIFIEKTGRIKDFIRFLKSDKQKTVSFFDNGHVYILCDNKIVGFSLVFTDYIGIDRNKVKNLIKSGRNTSVVYGDKFVKGILRNELSKHPYIAPYLYFLKQQD